MRLALPAAAILLAFASPALATGGFECRPMSGTGPIVSLGFGHAVAAPVFVAEIREGNRRLRASADPADPLRIGQSWIDRQHLWLDLVDANGSRFEAKLRATFRTKLKYNPAIGTLVRGGRTYRVRCVEA